MADFTNYVTIDKGTVSRSVSGFEHYYNDRRKILEEAYSQIEKEHSDFYQNLPWYKKPFYPKEVNFDDSLFLNKWDMVISSKGLPTEYYSIYQRLWINCKSELNNFLRTNAEEIQCNDDTVRFVVKFKDYAGV